MSPLSVANDVKMGGVIAATPPSPVAAPSPTVSNSSDMAAPAPTSESAQRLQPKNKRRLAETESPKPPSRRGPVRLNNDTN